MLSPADMLVVGVAALLFFGPDQLPKVARRAGQVVRDVQATSASFIREMERAADEPEHRPSYVAPEPYTPEPYAPEAPTVTIDHEPSTTTDHAAPPMTRATFASFDQTHPPLDEIHEPLDQFHAPPDQPHVTTPHTENGLTEVKPPETKRPDSKPPEPAAPI